MFAKHPETVLRRYCGRLAECQLTAAFTARVCLARRARPTLDGYISQRTRWLVLLAFGFLPATSNGMPTCVVATYRGLESAGGFRPRWSFVQRGSVLTMVPRFEALIVV